MDPVYNWIALIDRLSGGDITKHDQVYERNYIECLNLLAFWQKRDEYNKMLAKREQINRR